MRHKLLLTSAAVVLAAGTMLANAQNMPGQSGGSGGMNGGAAQRNEQPQGQQQRGEPQRQGQREQGSQRRETTGQAQREGQGKEMHRDGESREMQRQGQNKDNQRSEQRRETTGQGQREGQGRDAQHNDGQKREGQRNEHRRETTGQGEREGQGREMQREGQSKDNQRGEQRRETNGQGKDNQREGSRQGGQDRTNVNVNFTTEQRTRIRETVVRANNAPRVNNVNFAINVGTTIPRSVHVVTVPEVIVDVHPAWRGYYYFVVNDQLIIVDGDHRIVAVLDV